MMEFGMETLTPFSINTILSGYLSLIITGRCRRRDTSAVKKLGRRPAIYFEGAVPVNGLPAALGKPWMNAAVKT
jgi:hypothetical protein